MGATCGIGWRNSRYGRGLRRGYFVGYRMRSTIVLQLKVDCAERSQSVGIRPIMYFEAISNDVNELFLSGFASPLLPRDPPCHSYS